jgi:uroporphyrinogen-III synthase
MQLIENRVVKLEVVVDHLEHELKDLRSVSHELTSSLQAIEKTLTQLKWLAIGVATAFFIKEIGIDHVLLALIGGV